MGRPKDGKRYFEEIHQLLEKHGGSMEWRPQPPGGVWVMELHGRIAEVPLRRMEEPCLFDGMYVGQENGGRAVYPYQLSLGSFWQLMDIFHDQA